jgi:hypothetical protein
MSDRTLIFGDSLSDGSYAIGDGGAGSPTGSLVIVSSPSESTSTTTLLTRSAFGGFTFSESISAPHAKADDMRTDTVQGTVQTKGTSASSYDIALTDAEYFKFNISGFEIIEASGSPSRGERAVVVIENKDTNNGSSIGFADPIEFPGGSAPGSVGAGETDMFEAVSVDNGTRVLMRTLGQNFQPT